MNTPFPGLQPLAAVRNKRSENVEENWAPSSIAAQAWGEHAEEALVFSISAWLPQQSRGATQYVQLNGQLDTY